MEVVLNLKRAPPIKRGYLQKKALHSVKISGGKFMNPWQSSATNLLGRKDQKAREEVSSEKAQP